MKGRLLRFAAGAALDENDRLMRRVEELLAANNAEVERRRAAEAREREWLTHTDWVQEAMNDGTMPDAVRVASWGAHRGVAIKHYVEHLRSAAMAGQAVAEMATESGAHWARGCGELEVRAERAEALVQLLLREHVPPADCRKSFAGEATKGRTVAAGGSVHASGPYYVGDTPRHVLKQDEHGRAYREVAPPAARPSADPAPLDQWAFGPWRRVRPGTPCTDGHYQRRYDDGTDFSMLEPDYRQSGAFFADMDVRRAYRVGEWHDYTPGSDYAPPLAPGERCAVRLGDFETTITEYEGDHWVTPRRFKPWGRAQ